MSNKEGKSKFNLYHTFYSFKSFEKQNKNHNDILKDTKSILKNSMSFKNYIKNYKNKTEVISFKTPNITNYPKLNSKSLSLIPIIKTSFYKEGKKNKKKLKSIISCDNIKNNNNHSNFHNRIKINLNLLEKKYKKYLNKKNEQLNPIISDFFYKWTNNNLDDIKNPKMNNFSSLSYNEKNIFYSNYNDFLKEKIESMKTSTITNVQESIESEFFDKKRRKIKIELNSIKLIFKSLDKNNLENNKEQIINLPLSFAFLFYINGFEFFKKIILSSIQFSKNYKIVSFNDKNIYILIKRYFKNKKDLEKILNNEKIDKNINNPKQHGFIKKDTYNIGTKFKIRKSLTLTDKMINLRKTTIRGTSKSKKKEEDNKSKKIKIIHVNKEVERKIKENELLKEFRNNKKKLNYIKEKTYDEFEFIWETPFKTYKVIIQLPIIKIWCEHLKKTVITFCEKNLFLYMFKNNFINWDFHALHYFFSIKYFRKLIINKFSIQLKPLLIRNIINNYFINNRNKNNNIYSSESFNRDEEKNSLSNLEEILYTRDKKVNNLLDEKKESFTFFYTDNFNTNSIIDFHSYRINIDYEQLNPNQKWEYYLNFKQMIYLLKINKYELLETFLPKLIKTNFEYGNLYLDFSIINEFNYKILNYKKNKVFNKYKTIDEAINSKKIKDDLKLEIKNPYILIEKFVEGTRFSNISDEIEVAQNFLNKFTKVKNIIFWTKIILEIIEQKNKENKENEVDEEDELK